MVKNIQIRVDPKFINDLDYIRKKTHQTLKIGPTRIREIKIRKKSIDARKEKAVFILAIDVYIDVDPKEQEPEAIAYNIATEAEKVIIVGAGPAGYFAALQLLELGLKPIVLEQGKDVRARRRDLRAIQQDHLVDPQSNYCFGEGGAGTYSDGKLYTRAKKRGDIQKVLEILIQHGANPDIAIDAYPHIGSNKLPQIIANIRKTIIDGGGEIHFSTKVVDFIVEKDSIQGVLSDSGNEYFAKHVILATGHSARDMYYLCAAKGLHLQSKAFALGVRVEHPQALIDEIQYSQNPRVENLPAAKYSLACQIQRRGVFSFCMCPGGLIVPTATESGEIVLNGMSLSKRDSPFANAGLVVAIEPEDLESDSGADWEKTLLFQQQVEQSLFRLGSGDIKAPAQRLTDFVNQRLSKDLPKSSYIPGTYSLALHEHLPAMISQHLRKGIMVFDRKMKGYFTDEAVLLACESRTSSTVRIPREEISLMHRDLKGLYPCGEGAGYAGGILSAALDGQRVAIAIKKSL